MQEYQVTREPKKPHGNTKTGLPFHRLAVGESFRVPADDYSRTNSARAHYQKKNPKTKFSSRSIRKDEKNNEGPIVGYLFTRIK